MSQQVWRRTTRKALFDSCVKILIGKQNLRLMLQSDKVGETLVHAQVPLRMRILAGTGRETRRFDGTLKQAQNDGIDVYR